MLFFYISREIQIQLPIPKHAILLYLQRDTDSIAKELNGF